MARQTEQQPTERAYPGIEVFLETNERGAVTDAFAATREALAGVPKVKAEQAKRALAAIEHTENLLNQLFDVKEKMIADSKQPKKGKR